MGESKVQKEFKTSTFACTQYYMLMTTLSLRNSILSLMLIGGMAVSVNSFAQGRRGGFGGTRQSPSSKVGLQPLKGVVMSVQQPRRAVRHTAGRVLRKAARRSAAPWHQVAHHKATDVPPPAAQLKG